MKTQNMQDTFDSELAVFEIESNIKLTRPDIFNNRHGNFDSASCITLQNEVGFIISSLDEIHLMPKYKLIDIAKYAKSTGSIFAKAIIEIDYYNEITSINDTDEIKTIKSVANYNSLAYANCKKRINEIFRERFVKTKSISEIESIIAKCPAQCSAYDFGINMLLPHYKIKVDKFSFGFEISDYLDQIKHGRDVYLNSSKPGLDFLEYCHKRMYQLDIKQSDTKEEVLKIRNIVFNSYKDLVAMCDKKLTELAKVEDTDYFSSDKIMETYKYLTQAFQRRYLLLKSLSEVKAETDTNFYWFIYKELLKDFSENDNDIAMAKNKLVKAFCARTRDDDGFQVIYDIFCEPYEQNTDKVSQNLSEDEIVNKIIIERVDKATILELENSIVTFCYSRNYNIYQAFINRLFDLEPTVIDMLHFENKLFSIRSFLDDFNELMELFYSYVNSIIVQSVKDNKIIASEIEGYFALTKNETCNQAKKSLIQYIAKSHQD